MFKGLKALLAGILAGTALGVLFAPKKGDEIRKNIKKEETKEEPAKNEETETA